MGLITSLFERRGKSFFDLLMENRGVGYETASGRKITALGSLQNTAVFACARILAESEASLPLILYQRLERGKERATGHGLFDVLHTLANPEMTSVELRETLMGHLVLWGNAYAEIQRRGGRVVALWPLRPDRVDIRRMPSGELAYVVTMGDPLERDPEQAVLPWANVMHIKGLGYDGVKGYSPISLARQAVGLALATEEFGARFFGNGARPGVVLEHPGLLNDKAHERLKTSWEGRHQGLENSHRVAILEEGMKLHEVGIPPEDAQFLETRKFQVTEIARLFRVPPHMLADLERATFSNIEQQSLDFVIHSLRPWLVRWEQAISRDLLTPAERRQGYFAEHLIDALLRGDIVARYQSYAQGRQNGWLSANDIREMENMNPVPGGDVYLVPLNMIPAEQAAAGIDGVGESMPVDAPADSAGNGDAPARGSLRHAQGAGQAQGAGLAEEIEKRARGLAVTRSRLARSYGRIFEDVAGRVIRREVADVGRAARKYLGQRSAVDFREWLATFYQDHRAFWNRQIIPALLAYAEQIGIAVGDELGQEPRTAEEIRNFIEAYAAALGERQAIQSEEALRARLEQALAEGEDPEAAIVEKMGEIEATRPASVARWESVQAGNAFARSMYAVAGVLALRWVATGDNCPYCRSLNGRVVGIREFFLQAEEDFQPDGADRPLKRGSRIGHPPLHDGCDCQVVASL